MRPFHVFNMHFGFLVRIKSFYDGEQVTESARNTTAQISKIHPFPVGQQRNTHQFFRMGKTAQKAGKSGNGTLDIHQAPVFVKMPARHCRYLTPVGKLPGCIKQRAVFRIVNQDAARQPDILKRDVLRGCPDIGKALKGRGLCPRNEHSGIVIAYRRLGRVDISAVPLKKLVHIFALGQVFVGKPLQLAGKAGPPKPQKLNKKALE